MLYKLWKLEHPEEHRELRRQKIKKQIVKLKLNPEKYKEWKQRKYKIGRTAKHKYLKLNPWCKHRLNAKSRCAPAGRYYSRGIKCFLTIEEIKQLWFRDKAQLMVNPSIDRIAGGDSDYTYDNCRFIELRNNVVRGKLIIEICPHCGKNIYE